MLNDHHRNKLYDQAICAAAKYLAGRYTQQSSTHNESRPDDVVHALDIGSGTGLLGMLAATHLKEAFSSQDDPDKTNSNDPSDGACDDTNEVGSTSSRVIKVKVTSIEMASAMATIAKQTIQDNYLDRTIQVVEAHSTELPPATPPAQLCVSELLESGLLGEGILPALRDAWSRHLSLQYASEEQGDTNHAAIMIPQRARVFAQVVQSGSTIDGRGSSTSWISNFYGPHTNSLARVWERLIVPNHKTDNDVTTSTTLPKGSSVTPIHHRVQPDD
jgi:hypothetical protein